MSETFKPYKEVMDAPEIRRRLGCHVLNIKEGGTTSIVRAQIDLIEEVDLEEQLLIAQRWFEHTTQSGIDSSLLANFVAFEMVNSSHNELGLAVIIPDPVFIQVTGPAHLSPSTERTKRGIRQESSRNDILLKKFSLQRYFAARGHTLTLPAQGSLPMEFQLEWVKPKSKQIYLVT